MISFGASHARCQSEISQSSNLANVRASSVNVSARLSRTFAGMGDRMLSDFCLFPRAYRPILWRTFGGTRRRFRRRVRRERGALYLLGVPKSKVGSISRNLQMSLRVPSG
jgi:hypothetical protein